MKEEKTSGQGDPELARKNIRLAVILGLVALAFYVGFILMYV